MNKYSVYIDESGNYGFKFDKVGVTTHFVVTAIIVENDKLNKLKREIEKIRSLYFQTGEMKSNRIKNSKRRKVIFKALANKEFQIYSIVVNKKKLNQEGGLGYHKSFFKYLNGLLYNTLYDIHSNIDIYADSYGDKEFMEEFGVYLEKNHIPSLFERSYFKPSSSKKNVLIQLADLISGTILKRFERDGEEHDNILNILSNKIIGIETWPSNDFSITNYEKATTDNRFDLIIAEQSINAARNYVSKNRNSFDDIIQNKVNFLKYLLTCLTIGRDEFIKSDEIINNMKTFSKDNISKDYLMRSIVGPLRDDKILISSTNSGYKLPTTHQDLIDFVEFSSSIVLPMLNRLKNCRNRILIATNNELDIFAREEFKEIRKFFDMKYHRI